MLLIKSYLTLLNQMHSHEAVKLIFRLFYDGERIVRIRIESYKLDFAFACNFVTQMSKIAFTLLDIKTLEMP